MLREEILATTRDSGVVAVIRASSKDELLDTALALSDGGIKALEITMTSPNALDVTAEIRKSIDGDAVLGMGTVLDGETARMAILSGAQFIVSPILNHDIIEVCRRYSIPSIIGAFTPTEILNAWQAGADVVKVFPATRLGPSYFKDIKGPLPQVKLTPTGGVSLSNVGEFIKAGAEFVGVGGALVNKEMIKEKRWSDLGELARKFVNEVQKARN
ncbi:MAG: bifunctional 4-hydroxy-2-oxoglutarate aldolase/2-dehydro-3-deoxy-phosphogluconate aldolase [Bacillota bacterium]|nr:bifunctional 4-hydroxy-2-oxoglutarate aldolase/2-dehydro-3-deoxy-phosphogluconate aldolase [Bacillota bacterium]HHU60898.1 bifunctional 4-hydroxy-2-oxoglutarate aldolase/2-dehydro-3-deoxy-phosphogluconate aldolase [Natronincola sp.]